MKKRHNVFTESSGLKKNSTSRRRAVFRIDLSFAAVLLLGFLFGGPGGCRQTKSTPGASVWLTKADGSVLFEKQSQPLDFDNSSTDDGPTIIVDKGKTYQTMEGFGFALTGGSATLIHRLDAANRADLLENLFGTEGDGIGISYLRVSMGASDLSDHVFSYDDLPAGETDTDMSEFDLGPDKENVVPVLKEILTINPDIKILGSPWSPPTWMKTNHDSKGGSLMPRYYDAYALYFVKYIQAMKAEGIPVDAITVQNEPLHPGNNPSMLMLADEQTAFIKDHLGPAFRERGIKTRIITYDHNLDRIDYPLTVLNDPEARRYVDGSAFHLYAGTIDSMSLVHERYPGKKLYFTEQWVGVNSKFADELTWHTKNLIVGAPRNWSVTVLEWNLAADPNQNPHTDGGCTQCLGALTIGDQISRNVAYYIIAHASKFVRPGSVRIESTDLQTLPNVAYQTPAGQTVLIVLNDSSSDQQFNITENDHTASTSLDPGSVATYVW